MGNRAFIFPTPKIARLLKVPISEPLYRGHPSEFYPWSWTVTKWNEGHNPDFEKEMEYEQLAKDLADFLNDFHGIGLANGSKSRRGVSLKDVDLETRTAISALEGGDQYSVGYFFMESTVKYFNVA